MDTTTHKPNLSLLTHLPPKMEQPNPTQITPVMMTPSPSQSSEQPIKPTDVEKSQDDEQLWTREQLPTPPVSQKLHDEHDPEQDIEQGPAVVDLDTTPIQGPLLEAQFTESFTSVPLALAKPFTLNQFAALVEDTATHKLGLRQHLNHKFQVTLFDHHINLPERVIPFDTLWAMAHGYARFEIPTAEPQRGAQTCGTYPSCLHRPWFEAMRLAYEHLLKDVPSGQDETSAIVTATYASLLSVKRPLQSQLKIVQRPQQSAKLRLTRNLTSVATSTPAPRAATRPTRKALPTPVAKPSPKPAKAQTPLSVTSPSTAPSTTKKRKRAAGDDSTPQKRRDGKREGRDGNGHKATNTERFARAIKELLNDRSKTIDDFEAFDDIIPFLPDDNVTTADEQMVADDRKLTHGTFTCQKYRVFLGAALLTEQNLRMEKVVADWIARPNKVKGEKKPQLMAFNITQAQLWNNIDVNKMSVIFKAFEKWGWTSGMFEDPQKRDRVSAEYLRKYPGAFRKALFDKLIEWEDKNIKLAEHRSAIREEYSPNDERFA